MIFKETESNEPMIFKAKGEITHPQSELRRQKNLLRANKLKARKRKKVPARLDKETLDKKLESWGIDPLEYDLDHKDYHTWHDLSDDDSFQVSGSEEDEKAKAAEEATSILLPPQLDNYMGMRKKPRLRAPLLEPPEPANFQQFGQDVIKFMNTECLARDLGPSLKLEPTSSPPPGTSRGWEPPLRLKVTPGGELIKSKLTSSPPPGPSRDWELMESELTSSPPPGPSRDWGAVESESTSSPPPGPSRDWELMKSEPSSPPPGPSACLSCRSLGWSQGWYEGAIIISLVVLGFLRFESHRKNKSATKPQKP
uniref:Uncharacterized protein n=1 Tax=Pseudobryopsis hainanensis TaxID=2320808 RepID=A0A386AXW9_9CHLO|nr:hypothetical protein [Pseudobryopsis hainanensis]